MAFHAQKTQGNFGRGRGNSFRGRGQGRARGQFGPKYNNNMAGRQLGINRRMHNPKQIRVKSVEETITQLSLAFTSGTTPTQPNKKLHKGFRP
ncbi:hypothetical protein KY284_019562 [Solanum tuberosum]|nr:hypothetical protein KY284_019562 [Solanum tuberosum]